MITKKILIGGLPLLASVAVGGLCAGAAQAARPNIILIMADDLGYSDLGCFGAEIDTPNIDRLAKNGLTMTQFYTTPRCCPTRASLLTGLYPHQAGIGHMMQDRGLHGYRGELGKDTVTMAEELRGAGYATSMVGKWHVAHVFFDGKKQLDFKSQKPFWDNKDNWPLQRGFDRYYGTIHGVNSYYDPFSLVNGNTPIEAPDERKDFYYTDVITDKAVAEIDRFAGGGGGGDGDGKPFFLYVAYTAPHWPLQAPEAAIAKYRKRYLAGWDKIREERYQRQIKMGLIDKGWPLSPRDPRANDWGNVREREWEANRMATHAAMIEIMDQGVGRIHEQLKARGLDQNTLVIFLSDNGACDERVSANWYDVPSRLRDDRAVRVGNNDRTVMAGPEDVWQSYGIAWANVSDTPFVLYKHYTHEGGISAPFIAHWPAGIKTPGARTEQIGHIIDIMATFADIAGAKHPATYQGRQVQPLEGRSLVPVFQDQARPRDTPLFWEHEGNRAVRLGDWKLVAQNRKQWELYNIKIDRTEQDNLAATNQKKVRELSALYEAWARRCGVVPYSQLPKPIHRDNGAPE
ncbi:MAG: arylsulfatase [Opitutaceae bacterium]|jgi:arylsulfatase|nr:arylsulfatase [Opitutaceae bacterium]